MENIAENNYEKQLSELKYYKLHPELIPFVGSDYDNYKVLIVEESHFCDGDKIDEKDQKIIKDNWYKEDTQTLFKGYEERINEFNTRRVVSVFLGETKGKTKMNPSYSNFIRIITKFLNIDKTNAFNTLTFMNFFIRPEFKSGGSIQLSIDDKKSSNENFAEVVNVLKPEKIIFLSKKASECFKEYKKFDEKYLSEYTDDKIEYFCHPSSPWWNRERKDKKTNGKIKYSEEFRDCISKIYSELIQNYSPLKNIPGQKVFENLGINDSDLENFDEVEFE